MPGKQNTVADVLSCHPDLAVAIEVWSDLMGLIQASQARSESTEEWNQIKLDAANRRQNMTYMRGLSVAHVCCRSVNCTARGGKPERARPYEY